MFAVDNSDETLERLRKRGAQLVGEVVQYKNAYRLCYIRGPEGLLIGLAQELSRAKLQPAKRRAQPGLSRLEVLFSPWRFAASPR
jgi:hypothetical protein